MSLDPIVPQARYGRVAMTLHWLIALGIVAAVILAWITGGLDNGPQKTQILAVHKSIGLLIFALAAVRLAWRLTHPAPPYTTALPRWQRLGAGLGHGALYVLMVVTPITGYVSEAARGRETTFFWVQDVPRLVPLDRPLSYYAETAHAWGQYALYALIALHVGAAFYHKTVLRDQVFSRMWPRWRRQST